MSIASAMAAREAGPINRPMITLSIMTATLMIVLDTTIANVALPHMQGSLNASQDQVTWILTSYIVASAILTPLTGWLAGRLGRKTLFMVAIAGFTVASALCGIANSLVEIVLFRLLQGVFGAVVLPLSQSVLLDINPPEKHGQAMAVYGMGIMVGPILGPVLGGWLTDTYSWRWCFYINVPFGLLATAGVFMFIHGERHPNPAKLDLLGFATLSLGIGALQMMLDRGQSQDWFGSAEIWTEALLAALGFYWFAIQTATAEKPFMNRGLLVDRNFVAATIFGFFIGMLLYSTMALLPPLLQRLMGYPVLQTGLVQAPRGIGTLVAMFMVGRLSGKVSPRLMLLVGLALTVTSLTWMSHMSLQMGPAIIVEAGVLQGLGMGLVFVPLTTLAFATLSPALRTDGAGIFTLVRNIGSSVGISMVSAIQIRATETARSTLVEHVNATNPIVQALPGMLNPTAPAGAALLNGEVNRQASMVAYIDAFHVMSLICLAVVPMLLFLRSPKRAPQGKAEHVVLE